MSDQQPAGPMGWHDRPALSGTDVTDFLALQLVCRHPTSRVDRVGDRYVQNECPVLPFLADGLAALIEVGHLKLGEPEPGPIRPVRVTAAGRARYEQLCDRQGVSPYTGVRPMPTHY